MAASMGGAWKLYLESLGTGVPWFRDGKPTDLDVPKWGVVTEGIALAPSLDGGDYGDPDRHEGELEQVQLDLWQKARGPVVSGRANSLEDYELATTIRRALPRAAALQPFAPWRIYGVRVLTGLRWPISDNLLRVTWTVTVVRDVERIPVP
jgi:hypothetical protein